MPAGSSLLVSEWVAPLQRSKSLLHGALRPFVKTVAAAISLGTGASGHAAGWSSHRAQGQQNRVHLACTPRAVRKAATADVNTVSDQRWTQPGALTHANLLLQAHPWVPRAPAWTLARPLRPASAARCAASASMCCRSLQLAPERVRTQLEITCIPLCPTQAGRTHIAVLLSHLGFRVTDVTGNVAAF